MVWLHETIGAITGFLGISTVTFYRIFWTLIVIILFLLVRRGANEYFEKTITSVTKRYTARKSFSYIITLVTILMVMGIWIVGGKDLLAYFGILSAGLAIALQAPIINFAGWMFIVTRKPFVPGDRIEIDGIKGDVIDIELFKFSLMEIGNWVDADQSTGRVIHIPNGNAFKVPIANYTAGFRFLWNEIPVMITFESNWKKAKKILQKISQTCSDIDINKAEAQIKRASRKYMIYFKHLTPYVWTKVADSGVVLTIRYLTDPKKRRITEMQIWESILDAFSKHNDIDLAYPTKRSFFNREEGHPEIGGYKNLGAIAEMEAALKKAKEMKAPQRPKKPAKKAKKKKK